MKRILIVRTSAIGDVVFASPIIGALRRSHPGAHIAWLVEPGIHALLESDPALDELILWPKAAWRKLWRERHYLQLWQAVRELRRRLRAGRFDTVLDLQGLLKSGLLAWLSGAPQRVGLGSREGSRWLMTEVIPKGGIPERIGSEYLEFATRLGLDTGEFLPHLEVTPGVADAARARLAALGLVPGGYAVAAPFTTRPQKHWFATHWQALLPRVVAELELPVLILGGPGDSPAAAVIAAGRPGVHDLCGTTSLAEAAALIRDAALLIGVDTGLTHMGTAFAIPTVAIFGSTRPYLDTCRPTGRVIWLGLECSPCRRHPTCDGAYTCLREITPQRAFEEARLALAAREPRR